MRELTRRFPFDVRPRHRETVGSYGRRTLKANFSSSLHQQYLTGLATSSKKNSDRAEAWLGVLAAKTGRELRLATDPAGWLHHEDGTTCEFCAELLPTRHMCMLCAAGENIEQSPHFDTVVCIRHRRWVGVASNVAEQQAVGETEIAAELMFRKLRRHNRIDVRLYMLLLGAFSGSTEAAVFARVVAMANAVTSVAFTRLFFRVDVPFRDAHVLLSEVVKKTLSEAGESDGAGTVERSDLGEKLARALWLYFRPMMWAVHHAALTGVLGPVRPAWVHDFPSGASRHIEIRSNASAEPFSKYLDVTGDTALTAAQFGLTFTNERRLPISAVDPMRYVIAICDNGHQFPTKRAQPFAPAPTKSPRCPTCHGNRVAPGYNDLRTMRPDIACEFDEARNSGLTASDIAPGDSDVDYFWLCPQEHSYLATASNRTSANSTCPVCLNRLIQAGINDIATTHPEIVSELHPSCLAQGVASTEGAGSLASVDWLCAEGHEYTMRICDRAKRPGCPECLTGLRHQSDSRLPQTHPGLSRQWHSTLNGKLKPADFSRGSSHEAFWVCLNGHPPYKQRIERRTAGYKCPVCSNRKVATGINDIATTAPLMASEFQSHQNTPADVTRVFAGTKEYWWKCVAHGHILRQSGARRLLSRGCPKCPAAERVLAGLDGA